MWFIGFVAASLAGGTAANYMTYLRTACAMAGRPKVEWDDNSKKFSERAVGKMLLKMWGGPKRIPFLIPYALVQGLAVFNEMTQIVAMALVVVFNFEFLLPTNSEGLVVYMGEHDDVTKQESGKPLGRPNGVHISEKKFVNIMAKCKNRPRGSVLRRCCHCQRKGNQVCVVCDMTKLLKDKVPGDLVWKFDGARLISMIKTQLGMLGSKDGEKSFSWKSFRGGKATDMAKCGLSLGEILLAGEWRSRAFERYVDADRIVPIEIPEEAIKDSDNEAEQNAGDDGCRMAGDEG